MRAVVVAVALIAAACSGSGSAPATPTTPATTATTIAKATVEFVGEDRPARLVIPSSWQPTGSPVPLVVLLHGYSASGELQDVYLGVSATGSELGYLTLTPNGTVDGLGNQFWNVTSLDTPVDDSAYLASLIEHVVADYNADPGRVYLVGHSNGGFMANKLACEMPGRIAGIAAIAGGIFDAPSDCALPMPVLFIQGTEDGTVPYAGGSLLGGRVLGAEDTVDRWRQAGVCSPVSVQEGPFDYDLLVDGDETTITVWDDCETGVSVELWRMEGSGHVPGFSVDFRSALISHLLASSPEEG